MHSSADSASSLAPSEPAWMRERGMRIGLRCPRSETSAGGCLHASVSLIRSSFTAEAALLYGGPSGRSSIGRGGHLHQSMTCRGSGRSCSHEVEAWSSLSLSDVLAGPMTQWMSPIPGTLPASGNQRHRLRLLGHPSHLWQDPRRHHHAPCTSPPWTAHSQALPSEASSTPPHGAPLAPAVRPPFVHRTHAARALRDGAQVPCIAGPRARIHPTGRRFPERSIGDAHAPP